MGCPPTVAEIQRALEELRIPLQMELGELRARTERLRVSRPERPADTDRLHWLTAQFRRRVRREQQRLDGLPDSIYRTLVVRSRRSATLTAVALIPPHSTLSPVLTVRDWTVYAVPSTWHLQRCRSGDVVPLGVVVSVNGEPMLSEADCASALAAHAERRLTARASRKMERYLRALNYQRCVHERHERERERLETLERDRQEREAREQARRLKREQEEEQQSQIRLARTLKEEPEERETWQSLRKARMDRVPLELPEHAEELPDEAAAANGEWSDSGSSITGGAPVVKPAPESVVVKPGRRAFNPEKILVGGSTFCLGALIGCFVAPVYFSVFGFAALGLAAGLRWILRKFIARARSEAAGSGE